MTQLPFEASSPAAPDIHCRLDVARELVAGLATLTAAGQRYAMEKIVDVLSPQAAPSGPTAVRPAEPVGRWLDDLAHQTARLSPDVEVFSRRAMDIVAALRASTNAFTS